MQRTIAISFIGIILILVSAFILFKKSQQTQKTSVQTPTHQNEKVYPDSLGVNIKASFAIITDNTTRSFKAQKYHNQSPDVYTESLDPTIVHVKKTGITWDDFFQTLPMRLTKDCLVTGDGETFCNGKNGTLKFYLNDIDTPNLLDQEIKDGDKALIKFLLF